MTWPYLYSVNSWRPQYHYVVFLGYFSDLFLLLQIAFCILVRGSTSQRPRVFCWPGMSAQSTISLSSFKSTSRHTFSESPLAHWRWPDQNLKWILAYIRPLFTPPPPHFLPSVGSLCQILRLWTPQSRDLLFYVFCKKQTDGVIIITIIILRKILFFLTPVAYCCSWP